jgi:hypothetical protein
MGVNLVGVVKVMAVMVEMAMAAEELVEDSVVVEMVAMEIEVVVKVVNLQRGLVAAKVIRLFPTPSGHE